MSLFPPRTPPRRFRRALLLMGSLALVLVACGLVRPDLAPRDVITVIQPDVTLEGAYGDEVVRIDEHTVTVAYRVPAEVPPIYSVEIPISDAQRGHLEELAAAYIAYADSPWSDGADECTDTALDTVQVRGSIEHDSEMLDCRQDSPLRRLKTALGEVTGPVTTALAHPDENWQIEVGPRPGAGTAGATEEHYRLFPGEYSVPGWASAEGAPEGWGRTQAPGFRDRQIELDRETSAAVLTALNRVQLGADELGCEDPEQELRLVRTRSDTSTTWTHPVCPGQSPEALLEELRGL